MGTADRQSHRRPADLNHFEHPQTVLIDTARITRLFDPLYRHGDDIQFSIVFDNNSKLNVEVRDVKFDSQKVVDDSDIFVPFNETPRHKFFREADEGTLICNALDARIARHRDTLNAFTGDLAAQAPQLYEVPGTKYVFYTKPGDIDNVLVFTEQTDTARLTYKPHAGEVYGHPVMEEVYFKSPQAAIDGAKELRQKMAETSPQTSASKPPAP
jgi:hypothetical protein